MKVNFKTLSIISACISLLLALVWVLAPHILLSIWGLAYSNTAALISRRCGALFAGIALMFYMARNAEPSVARSAITSGFVISVLILAALGIFELFNGHAGIGILSAVITELSLAVAFLYATFKKGRFV